MKSLLDLSNFFLEQLAVLKQLEESKEKKKLTNINKSKIYNYFIKSK